MDPVTNEGIVGGERRTKRNNLFRLFAEDFGEATQPPDTNTVLGAIPVTPEEEISTVGGPTLHLLQRLLRVKLPELDKEMTRIH